MAEDLEAKVKTDASEVKSDFTKAETYVKAHIVWLIALGAFILGCATRLIHL